LGLGIGRARYQRGSVWRTDFEPTVGSDIGKQRPALIVSPNEMNAALLTVIIVPLTTRGKPAPFRVPVFFGWREGRAACDQVRAVSMGRLIRPLGALDSAVLDTVLAALRETLTM